MFYVHFSDKLLDIESAIKPIGGRVDKVSATEMVNSDSIPGRVKPKSIKIGSHSRVPCLTFSNKRRVRNIGVDRIFSWGEGGKSLVTCNDVI